MLKSFAPDDRADMVKDGKVVVTCEFCSSVYEFTPDEAGVEQRVRLASAASVIASGCRQGDEADRSARFVAVR